MIKKAVLIFSLCLLLTEGKADCLACWILEPVEVQLKNNTTKTGYLMWNDQWLNDPSADESFDKKIKNYHSEPGRGYLVLYEQVYQLGGHLPCEGVVTTESLIDSISIEMVRSVKQLPHKGEKISGAGLITTLQKQSIELLKNKPSCFYISESTVSETYFLSYDSETDVSQLQEISETSDYWLKRKSFEKQGIIIIMIAWD